MKHAALVSENKVADPSCQGSARGEVKAIQNSVSRGWARGTRRDPHPSTSCRARLHSTRYCYLVSEKVCFSCQSACAERSILSSSAHCGASTVVRHIAPNIASDADTKHDCIAGGVPWSRVRPRLC